jgi:hypothetical protein
MLNKMKIYLRSIQFASIFINLINSVIKHQTDSPRPPVSPGNLSTMNLFMFLLTLATAATVSAQSTPAPSTYAFVEAGLCKDSTDESYFVMYGPEIPDEGDDTKNAAAATSYCAPSATGFWIQLCWLSCVYPVDTSRLDPACLSLQWRRQPQSTSCVQSTVD